MRLTIWQYIVTYESEEARDFEPRVDLGPEFRGGLPHEVVRWNIGVNTPPEGVLTYFMGWLDFTLLRTPRYPPFLGYNLLKKRVNLPKISPFTRFYFINTVY